MAQRGFKIENAYSFADAHGLSDETARIRALPIHPSMKKGAAVRKGHLVELFEVRGLMEEFARLAWPARYSPSGENQRRRFLSYKAINEQRLIGVGPSPDTDPDIPDIDDEAVDELARFALEGQLRDFIADNLAQISVGSKRLKLFKDGDKTGIEYQTAVGRIDILALDDEGNFHVFELKLERGPDRALGQLARYMGWVKLNLARDKKVVGVIVASAIDDELRYAAHVIPEVMLLEYEVAFRLKDVGPMKSTVDQPSVQR